MILSSKKRTVTGRRVGGRWWLRAVGGLPVAFASGCVTVNAPDKPIVINLNISVTQEVVYRLDGQARSLIQSQPGIF